MKKMHLCLAAGVLLLSGSAMAQMEIGSRVECNWKSGGRWYSGTIAEKTGSAVFIHYDDGDKEHTTVHKCRLLPRTGGLHKGSLVSCRWKNGATWYPGVIKEKTGDAVFIHYNDGDKEHTTVDKCRPR